MKKAIMNTMIILFALAMCVGCGQSSEQKEESVPTDVTKAEKQEQVQVEAEDEDTLENGEQVFRVVEVMPKFPGGDAELLKFIIPADYIKNVVIVYQSSCEYSLSKILVSYCRLIILSLLRLKILAQIHYTIFVFILQYFPLKFSFLFLKVQESAVCGTF